MLKIFEYKNYKLHLNLEEILLVDEFKKIWEWDDTEDKSKAFEVFKYLFFIHDYKSPYREDSLIDRELAARESCDIPSRTLKTKMVEEAGEKYKKILRSNRILRMIDDMYMGMDELSTYFRTINFQEKVEHGASKGKLLHSPTELMRVIEKADKLLETLKALRKKAEEEYSKESDTWGDAEGGLIDS